MMWLMAEAFDWNTMWSTVGNWLATNGLKLVVGLVVLMLSFWLVNLIAKLVKRGMIKHGVEKTIYTVTYSIMRKGLKILFFLVFLGFIGVQTASIGAIIASAGVAIGLALQGSLSNFAGGVIILLMHPFKIGDYIEAQGQAGTVDDIHMFHTMLVTPDNKVVILPNGALSNGAVVNYSTKALRRVDLLFSVGYGQDLDHAKEVIGKVCDEHSLILKKPEPLIRVSAHKTSSVDIIVRVWVKNEDYWTVNFDLLETVKRRFDEEKIEIPFPQLDVHCEMKPEKDGKDKQAGDPPAINKNRE